EILRALERYALTWDGEVVYQSQRIPLYEAALNELRSKNAVFDCACSRADLQRAASAPVGEEPVYPGTCRHGIPDGRAPRAVRFLGVEVQLATPAEMLRQALASAPVWRGLSCPRPGSAG